MKKSEIIEKLKLIPLENEGGYVKELYRGEDNCYGTIYYLLGEDDFSAMHSLKHDEIWYYHDGPSLEMLLVYEDHDEIRYLGKDIANDEEPQIRVPANVYMGARQKEKGEYTLVSTSMAPAYDPDEFKIASYDDLKDRCQFKEVLSKLTK